jgi:hypothetical protein
MNLLIVEIEEEHCFEEAVAQEKKIAAPNPT